MLAFEREVPLTAAVSATAHRNVLMSLRDHEKRPVFQSREKRDDARLDDEPTVGAGGGGHFSETFRESGG